MHPTRVHVKTMNATKTLIAAAIVALAGVSAIPSVAALGDPDACTERWVTGEKDDGQIMDTENAPSDSIEGEFNEFRADSQPIEDKSIELVVGVQDATVDYGLCLVG